MPPIALFYYSMRIESYDHTFQHGELTTAKPSNYLPYSVRRVHGRCRIRPYVRDRDLV